MTIKKKAKKNTSFAIFEAKKVKAQKLDRLIYTDRKTTNFCWAFFSFVVTKVLQKALDLNVKAWLKIQSFEESKGVKCGVGIIVEENKFFFKL
jgi:hypothetical protein